MPESQLGSTAKSVIGEEREPSDDVLLISTYRHWIWSDGMKELFEVHLAHEEPQVDIMASDFFLILHRDLERPRYALLYATCEGLQAGKVNVAEEIYRTHHGGATSCGYFGMQHFTFKNT